MHNRYASDKQLTFLLKYANTAEFLFADYVIVVEGPSDRELLMASWTKLCQSGQVNSNISLAILDAGNKSVVPVWVRYLKSIGMNAIGVVDLDFIWEGAGAVLKSNPCLSKLTDNFWHECEKKQLIVTNDDKNKRQIRSQSKTSAFEILTKIFGDDTELIRQELINHHIWVLRIGEIETYFGLHQSSKGCYTQISQKILRDEMKIHDEILEILKWSIQNQ